MRVAIAAAVCCVLASGCQLAEAPELLRVSELGPVVVSSGDRIELRGEGFPEGRAATLVFRGEVRRAGARPLADVEIAAAGFAHSATQLTATLDDEVTRRFVGAAETALHSTFHGDVRLVFESRSATAPHVVGTLQGVTLDVVPPALGALHEERQQQGRLLLDHLGISTRAGGAPGSLVVGSLIPGGRADALGLLAGDTLTSFSGVTVRGVADLAVAPRDDVASLRVRRLGVAAPFERAIDVSALTPDAPSDLAAASVVLGSALALLLLIFGPLPPLVTWLERGVLLGRPRSRHRRAVDVARFFEWLSPPEHGQPRGFLAPLLTFVVVVLAFTLMGFGRSLGSPESDLPIAYGSATVALLAGRLAEGGSAGRGFSLARGLLAVLATLAFVLPGLIGLVALAAATESVSLQDIGASQGGAPWRFRAFTNPGLGVAALLLLVSAVPVGVSTGRRFSGVEGIAAVDAPSRLAGMARWAEWLHAWAMCALAVAACFGGWQVPLVSAVWTPSLLVSALGASLFVVKLWALMFVLVLWRALAARVGVTLLVEIAALRAFLLAIASGAVAVVWAEASERWDLPVVASGAWLVTVAFGVAVYVLFRLRAAGDREAPYGAVNPWL